MFVPGVQQGMHLRVPRRAATFVFALVSLSAVLVVWAALPGRHARDDSALSGLVPAALPLLGSVALIVPDGPVDHLFVQTAQANGRRAFLTDFPSTFTLHARGLASPQGESVAVLWVDGAPVSAHLTVVHTRTGSRVEADGAYAYMATLVWAPQGDSVTVLGPIQRDAAGRFNANIVQVDAVRGSAETVATFPAVFDANPVGYSMDGERLFVVIVDESGSALWSVQRGKSQRGAQLSAGRTRDWTLSPNGARLAFTEVYGAGGAERSPGRVLNIATGAITSVGRDGIQIGPTWRTDSETPHFGGPDGDVQLVEGEPGTYLAPHAWAADGSALVASVRNRDASATSLQLVRPDSRFVLAEEPGAAFLGFVVDIN